MNNTMEWTNVDHEGNVCTFTIKDADHGTWMDLLEHFQKFLTASGFVFGEEFSLAEACEDAHALYIEEKYPVAHTTVPHED